MLKRKGAVKLVEIRGRDSKFSYTVPEPERESRQKKIAIEQKKVVLTGATEIRTPASTVVVLSTMWRPTPRL